MDASIDALTQLLVDWDYVGLFVSTLLTGGIAPSSSGLVMTTLVRVGLGPTIYVLVATLGNTTGGMTCYYMGRLGKIGWVEKYFEIRKKKIDKMQRFLRGRGASMAFFTFLPLVGEVVAIALGFMHSNATLTVFSMFVGKLIRYIIILLALQGALPVINGQ